MTSVYMPKQFQFNENSSHTNRIQQYNLIMSNEETKQLAGLVAKTRALFENNNSTKRFIQEEQPKRAANNRVQHKQLINENDSDKENSTTNKKLNQTETVAPFLNQLKPSSKLASKFQTIFNSTNLQSDNLPTIAQQQLIKNQNWNMNQYKSASPPLYSSSSASSASSSPPPSSLSYQSFESNNPIIQTSNLWQQSEQCRKEFNLPMSVQQAKLCFERNIQQQSSVRSTPIQQIKSKPFVKTVLLQGESPIFSSSSSSSTSSVPSSPTSSLDSTNRFKLIDQNKSAFNYKQSVHLPILPQQPQLTPNNKIKILKKNFTKNLTPNEEVKDESKYLHKTSKYLQLYNDNTAISPTTTTKMHEIDNENLKYPATSTSTASIQIKTIKLKQQEPVVSIKSILRNKTPADCVVPQQQPQQIVSPQLNERYVNQFIEQIEPELNCVVKVDQSSCVLPSKLKNKNINEEIKHQPTQQQQQTVVKSNNFRQWQQPKVESNVGFVKNNINSTNLTNCNNGSNTNNVAKRANKNAATAKENLLRWCRRHTQSYQNISIENFSSSWSNGLAFCALIHSFMPDSFDYYSLDSINARRNFELAFKTAEDKAGIVQLLDVDDMIEMGNAPDWKCVFTYVHSIYQKFREAPAS